MVEVIGQVIGTFLFIGYFTWWVPFLLWPVRKKIGWWLYDAWWNVMQGIGRLINAPYEARMRKWCDELDMDYARKPLPSGTSDAASDGMRQLSDALVMMATAGKVTLGAQHQTIEPYQVQPDYEAMQIGDAGYNAEVRCDWR